MKGGIEWLLAFYACQKLGVGLALIHLRLLPEEMLRMVALTGADTLICSTEYMPQAEYIAEHSGRDFRMIVQGGKKTLRRARIPLKTSCAGRTAPTRRRA